MSMQDEERKLIITKVLQTSLNNDGKRVLINKLRNIEPDRRRSFEDKKYLDPEIKI